MARRHARSGWQALLVGAAAVAVAAAAGMAPRAAHASLPDVSLRPGWHVPVGLNLGVATGQSPRVARGGVGALLGLEASLVRLSDDETWRGMYVDALFDTAVTRARLSVGAELGCHVLGLDAGPVVELGGRRPQLGGRVRGMLTLGLATLYAGATRLPSRLETVAEAGLLFKLPLRLGD